MNTNKDFANYIGHDVVDNNRNKVGTLDCLWTDHTGQPAFLGVKTGWFMGKTHVVPAHAASVSERGRAIRVAYDADRIKEAPACEGDVQLDEATERRISSYYGIPFETQQTTRTEQQTERSAGAREQASVPLREEELKVGKREVEYGGIRLRKIIRTETVNQPVELQREEIMVERVPGKQSAERGKAFQQEDIFIPLRREEPVVQKEARVREEVRVSKRTETDRKTVSEQVRKEDVQVERSGKQGATARSATTGTGTRPAAARDQRGRKAVFGIVNSETDAARVVDALKAGGFTRDDISVMLSDKRSSKEFAHEKNTKAPEGATTGAATGGVLGGTLGWLAGAGALAIPGVGPLIAAGPIMAALSGAALGAATGGIAGGLIGLGIPEYEAKRYEDRIRQGHVLVSVHADSSEEIRRAKDILERNRAEDIGTAREERETAVRN
jgi:uncharacterized protein (TIGR02271 family)